MHEGGWHGRGKPAGQRSAQVGGRPADGTEYMEGVL